MAYMISTLASSTFILRMRHNKYFVEMLNKLA